MEAPIACGLATCQTRSCARMTSWSGFTPLVSTFWIPKSETASSSAFCGIACRSFWAMTWPGSWSGSDLACVDSSPATEVYARPADGRIGAFAEFSAIKEDDVAIKPKALTMEEAASIPLVGLTAWQALIEKAKLKKGQKVLIHAGSGGVGTFAIQLAKHVGATVATTTSTANIDLVRRLGADIVIDYKKDRFEEILRDCDVVLNSLDGETLKKSLRVLKPGGNLISISGPPDPEFARQLGSNWILELVMRLLSFRIRRQAKRHQVNYSFLFMRGSGDQCRQIGSLIGTGARHPVPD